jgi:biotin carboxylase
MKQKLVVLGASYLQKPLIIKAKSLNIETHVFAYQEGAVAKSISDFFYPISILDKFSILKVCQKIQPDGITSIASDIAMPTVNYIANEIGLTGNSNEATVKSTDKYEMRKALNNAKIPCPRFNLYGEAVFNNIENFNFPLIVKPTDRSGSRGVTKVFNIKETNEAILKALCNSINRRVIVEEFIESDHEFSIEFISYKGFHYPITITDKVTTGPPYFTEIEHHQPANISENIKKDMFNLTIKILDTLEIKNGASHTEVYLLKNNEIKIVECAGRMGGDLIGSHMVQLSTGFDYLHATIDVALNQFCYEKYWGNVTKKYSGVHYVIPKIGIIKSLKDNSKYYPEIVYSEAIMKIGDKVSNFIDGSDKRAGIIVYSSDIPKPINDPNKVLQFWTEN